MKQSEYMKSSKMYILDPITKEKLITFSWECEVFVPDIKIEGAKLFYLRGDEHENSI